MPMKIDITLKIRNTFIANTYPMNYEEITGLPCRVVADI